MGAVRTPTFRVEHDVKSTTHGMTHATWHSRQYGRPTARNLRNYVHRYNESIKPGGCNAHLSADMEIIRARIVRQSTGEPVAVLVRGS